MNNQIGSCDKVLIDTYLFCCTEEKTEPEDSGRLRCETFDIQRVLQHGAHLMGSEGYEYDLDEEPVNAAGKHHCIITSLTSTTVTVTLLTLPTDGIKLSFFFQYPLSNYYLAVEND